MGVIRPAKGARRGHKGNRDTAPEKNRNPPKKIKGGLKKEGGGERKVVAQKKNWEK